ncbi:MAG: ribosome-associated translation inhibitor RaiA [Patescibacteria group bacterium]|jgi:ribosomal subunit interface protein
MKLIISAKDFRVNQWLKDYSAKKMDKLEKLLPADAEAKIELDHDHNQHTGLVYRAEASVLLGGKTIKAGEKGTTMEAAIDLTVPKLIQQVKKFKDKRQTLQRRSTR